MLISVFVCPLQRVEGTGVEGRDREQLSLAVVHSCQNHAGRQTLVNKLSCGFSLGQTFFSVSGPF